VAYSFRVYFSDTATDMGGHLLTKGFKATLCFFFGLDCGQSLKILQCEFCVDYNRSRRVGQIYQAIRLFAVR